MKSKKLTGILIAAVIVLLVCVVGTTFAYYFATLRGKNENTISTSKATLLLTEQDYTNERAEILPESKGRYSGTSYDFTINATSTGNSTIGYVIYLEEAEGNTLDPSLIHFNLTSDEYDWMVDELYEPTEKYCYNYETGEVVAGSEGIGCDHKNETIANSIATYETLEDGTQLRHITYYPTNNKESGCVDFVQINENGNWNMYGKGWPVSCNYGTYQPRYINSLVGENNFATYYKNQNGNLGGIQYNINIDDFENVLFVGRIGTAYGVTSDTHTYHLKYWISEEELAKQGTIEGTVNNDGSVGVELGQDAIFKFKIGVYAKSMSPS